jgi:DNA-binding transcriptional MerR regulator
MKVIKTYYSISEVAKILNIKEHTIRFWDSKLPGLSKQSQKGKTRFFNENHIKKLSSLNQLLENNDSIELAFKIISKFKKNKLIDTFFDNSKNLDGSLLSKEKIERINKINKKLKNLLNYK